MYSKSKTQNLIYNFLFTGLSYVFPVVSLLYISRVLMPETLGSVSFASSVAAYFAIAARLGLPIYGLRICAKHRDNREALSRTVTELLTLNLIISALCYLLLIASSFFVERLASRRALLLIFGCGMFLQSVGCEWLFKALGEFRYIALRSFAVKLIALAGMLIFVRSPDDCLIYAVLSLISVNGAYAVNAFMLKKYVDLHICRGLNLRQHIRPLLVFFLMSCATAVYDSLDTVMLGFMQTDTAVGLYSIVGKAKTMLTILGGVIWTVMLPEATRLWGEGNIKEFEALSKKSVSLILLLQLPLMLFCLIFADRLVFIIGGEKYLPAVTAFRITLLSLLPIGLSNIMGTQVLIPAGFEKKLLFAELAAAGLNFVLNLLFIPRFSIEGAAFTTVLAEILVWLVVQKQIHRHIGIRLFELRSLLLIALSAAVSSALLYAAALRFPFSGGTFLAVFLQTALFAVAFGVIYLGCLLLLGERSTLNILLGIIKRKKN